MSDKVMGTPGDLVTRRSAARILKVTTRTITNLVAQGLLQPVWKKKKQFFYRADVVALLEVFRGKMDLASVANTAVRAFVRTQQCERRITELMDLLGFTSIPLDTTEGAVLGLYRRAKDLREETEPVLNASQLFHFAKELLAVTEEYLRLAEHYTADPEPWRIYLNACQTLSKLAPRERFIEDHELAAAYGYVDAARRHVRSVAYFFVRAMHGKNVADQAFVGDGAFDPLITTLFPN